MANCQTTFLQLDELDLDDADCSLKIQCKLPDWLPLLFTTEAIGRYQRQALQFTSFHRDLTALIFSNFFRSNQQDQLYMNKQMNKTASHCKLAWIDQHQRFCRIIIKISSRSNNNNKSELVGFLLQLLQELRRYKSFVKDISVVVFLYGKIGFELVAGGASKSVKFLLVNQQQIDTIVS